MSGLQVVLAVLVVASIAAHVVQRFAPHPSVIRRTAIDLVGLVALAILVLSATVIRIPPGYVGIKVNNLGAHRGVQDIALRTGLVFYTPVASTVFEYPTFVQTAVWTRSAHEGRPVNEEISFNSGEGLVFTADVSLAYRLEEARVPHFYVQFRSDDLSAFTHGYLRNVARDAFNELAARYTAEEVYGTKREQLLGQVKERINSEVSGFGAHRAAGVHRSAARATADRRCHQRQDQSDPGRAPRRERAAPGPRAGGQGRGRGGGQGPREPAAGVVAERRAAAVAAAGDHRERDRQVGRAPTDGGGAVQRSLAVAPRRGSDAAGEVARPTAC